VATDKDDFAMRQREKAFMSRYDALYEWACSLTNDPVEAEDLLQDCYVFFVTANTNKPIEDLDGYLRRMLSNVLRSNRMRQAPHNNGELNHPIKPRAHRTPVAAHLSLDNSPENRMFGQHKFNNAETERSRWQIVADAYTHLWDFFWLPIGLVSKLLWRLRLFPRQWAPWMFGSRFGRWPKRINYEHYTICSDADCDTCRSLGPGELDIDNEKEVTHDPFHILSNLKRSG
jgi:DNA-directed RNA polymerase specialized sigma24 family protein